MFDFMKQYEHDKMIDFILEIISDLILLLVKKGVLTKDDALEIINKSKEKNGEG